jgi:hypothetical protein
MSCAHPIDAAILADYWIAALPQDDEGAIEEHLLACAECGARLREIVALADGVRTLARQGSLTMVISDSFLNRVAAEGFRVREYAPQRSGSIACTVTAEDDFLIGRLSADLSGARRIDLAFCDGNGMERHRLPDVPFHPAAGSVAFQQSITYAKAAQSETIVARLITYDDAGAERLLGEYTFNHTRTM